MNDMMIRKQISIEARNESTLKREARRRGISESAIIREFLDELESRTHASAWEAASAAIGSVQSTPGENLSEHHDDYLYGPIVQ